MIFINPDVQYVLRNSKTIAIVGLSPKDNRPSNDVARYLMAAGYEIIPVNPGQDEILGRKCYPRLADIQVQVDVVDIFRRSEEVMPVVEDAIAIKAKAVWMQLGIVNEAAADKARAAGLRVIMDRCIKTDHMDL